MIDKLLPILSPIEILRLTGGAGETMEIGTFADLIPGYSPSKYGNIVRVIHVMIRYIFTIHYCSKAEYPPNLILFSPKFSPVEKRSRNI